MKIIPINKTAIMPKAATVKKGINRLAAVVLGTGLALSAGSAKANQLTNDFMQKEADEMCLSATDNIETAEEKDNHIKGGLIFGGALLAYMGLCVLGNKLHDKNNNQR